ncbi:FkbM family methyltransferase [Aquabacterium sp. A7-Y]|uniref:FkbM family methyltransferase n=1 Tax=Aquabacterium sp. A7-Y TaxID=1349605 RepID=UPI00223D3062|nr:FkbM family methyltransferase [Aquabacterium sp. A7-Y]MCW7537821.1 FkbM family methyltransferase [Aquabacterium sp. A7-Y]
MPNRSPLKQFAEILLPRSAIVRFQVHRGLRGSPDREAQLLPLLARRGCFLDIGANRGSWAGPAARVFREVHAFEPEPELAAALRKAAPANVTVHGLALSDHEGWGRFAVPVYGGEAVTTRATLEAGANVGFERELVHEVQLARLDSLRLRHVDAIKIDVEGHEAAVLEGAWDTIDREHPPLIVEIEERHHPGESESIIERLAAHDYLCYYIGDEGLESFVPGSIEVLQQDRARPDPGRRPGGYINNFIFWPRERHRELAGLESFVAAQLH